MSLKSDLITWDGKNIDDIIAIYSHHSKSEDFLADLLALITSDELQSGSTWLLKHHLENKYSISAHETKVVFNSLIELRPWQAKLHILQCLPYLTVSPSDEKQIEHFLHHCLMSNNKFVRAWAYNGFYELSQQYPKYTEETKEIFEMAMRDEAPSVKARIRNILKTGF